MKKIIYVLLFIHSVNIYPGILTDIFKTKEDKFIEKRNRVFGTLLMGISGLILIKKPTSILRWMLAGTTMIANSILHENITDAEQLEDLTFREIENIVKSSPDRAKESFSHFTEDVGDIVEYIKESEGLD